jgi:hypothetical protein
MLCPVCQFDNIKGSKFCNKCGHKLLVVCPRCGYSQPYSEECAKCGIIFDKFIKREPIKEKTYRVKRSYLLLIKSLFTGCFILAGLIIYYRNSIPAGVEGAVVIGIFLIVVGVLCLYLYIKDRSYFVSVTEKGINIANRKIIPWEDIYNVEWNNILVGKRQRFSPRRQWIDIYIPDEVKQKIVKITISEKIESVEFLYDRIMRRVHSDIDSIKDPVETNVRMLIEWGIWMMGLLIIFFLMVASPEGEIFILMKNNPRLSIMIGIIFFITGIILFFRWRE